MEQYEYDEESRFGSGGDYRTGSFEGDGGDAHDYHDHHQHRGNFLHDSDEDTEDASETESMKPGDQEEFHHHHHYHHHHRPVEEMKEECFRSRLAELHGQLAQLEAGTHPAWVSGVAKLQANYEAAKFELNCHLDWTLKRIDREFEAEKRAAIAEFEERRHEMKEALQADLDEQRRRFRETEHHDLLMDAVEPKQVVRRQLRNRRGGGGGPGNDQQGPSSDRHHHQLGLSASASERAHPPRRPMQPPLKPSDLPLEEEQVNEDLKLMEKFTTESKREENLSRKTRAAEWLQQQHQFAKNTSAAASGTFSGNGGDHQYYHQQPAALPMVDARIEGGKLFYNKKWFHRGQNVMLESTELGGTKQPGNILQIGAHDLTIRRVADSLTTSASSFSKQSNMKVTVADLQARKASSCTTLPIQLHLPG
ncbi:Sin3 histone deacetylase corepressor complex component SDS3 [Tyrophagus putrescentiae]|nr:Sin3 histone deacetylase corepressor complex component SDS3 [Tyrophagus putrescentiae]